LEFNEICFWMRIAACGLGVSRSKRNVVHPLWAGVGSSFARIAHSIDEAA
jgi:hypothetical protein